MGRQRYVYPTDEIAHLWMHQTQCSARNPQDNFYFRDTTIYSYGGHFAIAKHVWHKNKRAIIFTLHRYSSTTAKHVRLTYRAIPDSATVFRTKAEVDASPKEILADFVRRYENAVKHSKEGNRVSRGDRMTAWDNLAQEANQFSAFFGLRKKFKRPDPDELNEAVNVSAELRYAQRERAKERDRLESEARQVTRDREQREAAMELADKIARWKRGEAGVRIPNDHKKIYLRIIGDNIQTSRGARVPVSAAEMLLPLARAGCDYRPPPGQQIRVGHYPLTCVDKAGNATISCQRIERDEIERIAAILHPQEGSEPVQRTRRLIRPNIVRQLISSTHVETSSCP